MLVVRSIYNFFHHHLIENMGEKKKSDFNQIKHQTSNWNFRSTIIRSISGQFTLEYICDCGCLYIFCERCRSKMDETPKSFWAHKNYKFLQHFPSYRELLRFYQSWCRINYKIVQFKTFYFLRWFNTDQNWKVMKFFVFLSQKMIFRFKLKEFSTSHMCISCSKSSI